MEICDQWKNKRHEICNDCPDTDCIGGNCPLKKGVHNGFGEKLSIAEQNALFGDIL